MKSFHLQKILYVFLIIIPVFLSCKEKGTLKVSILSTTDIHGVILPYDYIDMKPLDASLSHASGFIRQMRNKKDAVFLLDNGDNLQGQPAVYYYNYIDTVSRHFLSEVFNWLGYDAVTAGNHDIEAGHSVYDKLVTEYNFPVLAANAINTETGKPYFQPYVILEKKGIRVAVFGLITPAIPRWLSEELYSGMEFRDMVETAKLWMPEIVKENADLVVGLFHSGWNKEKTGYKPSDENGSAAVAFNVPGFDIIFTGHDHRVVNEPFINKEGDTVLILNAGSRSENIACADINFIVRDNELIQLKGISGSIIENHNLAPDPEFTRRFREQEKAIYEYVSKVIGESVSEISSRDSYFGSSAYVDMVHAIQLELSGADVSFAAPLSFDETISEGPLTVGDMFKLYRFENMLYTIRLTGEEICKYLEYSYAGWLNAMKGPDDYLIKYRLGKNGKPFLINGRASLKNQSYNFDSAAGIDYIVDVSRPEGHMVIIKSLSDGHLFELKKSYDVAVNSFRGNGGGGHLTRGAGIKESEIGSKLIKSTERDLRYYILKSVEKEKILNPVPLNNWKIVPEKWVDNRIKKEKLLLFGLTN